MKKTLLILSAVAAFGLVVVACAGLNPTTVPVLGQTESSDCPDFTGTYDIAIHDQPTNGCEYSYLEEGDATLTVVQDGENVTITYEDSCYTFVFEGTIDCDGNFTATESGQGLVLTGNLSTVSGTFADPEWSCDYCTYPWDTVLFGYQDACWCD